jgi:hypothetical protein
MMNPVSEHIGLNDIWSHVARASAEGEIFSYSVGENI